MFSNLLVLRPMKKLFFFIFLFPLFAFAQEPIVLKGNVFDGVSFFPITGANIYNFNSKMFSFTDKEGKFEIMAKKGDTIIVSKPNYKQKLLVLTQPMIEKKSVEISLFFKTIILREVVVYALPSTYEKFKKDFVNVTLSEINKEMEGTALTKQDMINAEYSGGGSQGNILRNTPAASPITWLYDRFSKKKKMERLYIELVGNQKEVDNLPLKYNRELVSSITGLYGDELLNFMTFCKFSYYDLIRWSPEYIITLIENKFDDYEFYKALEGN